MPAARPRATSIDGDLRREAVVGYVLTEARGVCRHRFDGVHMLRRCRCDPREVERPDADVGTDIHDDGVGIEGAAQDAIQVRLVDPEPVERGLRQVAPVEPQPHAES